MIKKLRIKNFKSWQDTGDMEFAPMTVLFGANSSGKTSILQFLLMLKQTAESTDMRQVLNFGNEKSLVDLQSFYDVIFRHDEEKDISFELKADIDNKFFHRIISNFKIGLVKDNEICTKRFIIEYPFSKYLINLKYGYYQKIMKSNIDLLYLFALPPIFPGSPFFIKWALSEPTYINIEMKGYNDGFPGFSVEKEGISGIKFGLPPKILIDLQEFIDTDKLYFIKVEPSKFYMPMERVEFIDLNKNDILNKFANDFENLLSKISYIGPIREYPKRTYTWTGTSPENVGKSGELAIQAILSGKMRKKLKEESLEEKVEKILKKMNLVGSFRLKDRDPKRKEYALVVTPTGDNTEIFLTDVGFGLSQLLPILVQCFYAPEYSIILLEQPCIHLHPKIHADLADVLIDVIKERKLQFVIESHSEHFLRRIQRRIAEEKISSDDVRLYFCRLEKGESKLEKLKTDKYGNITNWPEDFFGDEIGDLSAMTIAEMKRREEEENNK